MFQIIVGHNDQDGNSTGNEATEIRECVRIAFLESGPGAIKLDAAQVVTGAGFCAEYGAEGNSIVTCFGDRAEVDKLAARLVLSQRQACVAVVEIPSQTYFINAEV